MSQGHYCKTVKVAERFCSFTAIVGARGSFFFFFPPRGKAADLRAMLKSHNKVIIQGKHLCSADSNAVDGCKLIMNPDTPPLELMAHLLKPFTCPRRAVKEKEEK